MKLNCHVIDKVDRRKRKGVQEKLGREKNQGRIWDDWREREEGQERGRKEEETKNEQWIL